MKDGAKKIYWLPGLNPTAAQQYVLRTLHGVYVEVVRDQVKAFSNAGGLADYIRSHPEGFVYAGSTHAPSQYIVATQAGMRFGFFEPLPPGEVGTSAGFVVYHVVGAGQITKVWTNPDPRNQYGRSLLSAFPGY